MVALITGSSLQLCGPASVERPRLRVIQGGLDAPERDYSSVVVAVAVSLVLLMVMGLRMLQGGPPADTSAAGTSLAGSVATVAVADPGETMLVVQSGDSLWAIAEALAPGRDPRPIVDALADRNGGTVLRAGDVLVVPVELQQAQPSVGLAAAVGSTP